MSPDSFMYSYILWSSKEFLEGHLSSLSLSLYPSFFIFTSFFCFSEDLKGPETKPQLVLHDCHAHLSAFHV